MIVDKFGHCINCGKNLIVERVMKTFTGMELKKVFLPDYDQIQVVLDDGSKMRITMCKPCKGKLEEKDYPKIMKSVIAGWQKEVDNIPHWSKEKKENHMKVYKKKKIKEKVKDFKFEEVT
jgi:hypothetical protein